MTPRATLNRKMAQLLSSGLTSVSAESCSSAIKSGTMSAMDPRVG
jgi:hypothetical protein